jgi:hypothetical protein
MLVVVLVVLVSLLLALMKLVLCMKLPTLTVLLAMAIRVGGMVDAAAIVDDGSAAGAESTESNGAGAEAA